jgi:hypothetical protein
MLLRLPALLLLLAVVLVPALGGAETPFTLTSVAVDLPDSDRMFSGPGSDALNDNCLACHSAGMVLNQPVLAKATWLALVNKMIHIYKAPVAEKDVGAIVDYLARIKGAD